MTPKLPPLPYAGHADLEWNIEMQDILRAYGLACYQQGMQRAAEICETECVSVTAALEYQAIAAHCAITIRKEVTP